jgi:hypothetical protein
MMEIEALQYKGFRNLKNENGDVWGFQVGIRFVAYRGPWLSQFRFAYVKVDDVEYGPDVCTFFVNGVEYTYAEMLKPENWRVKVQMQAPIYIHVKKEGGLAMGCHRVSVKFSEIASYIPERMDDINSEMFEMMHGNDPAYNRDMIIV